MSDYAELGAVRFRREYAGSLLKLADMLAPCVQLHKWELSLRDVVRNMDNPFRIAVFGYMKRGKSSIINALVGRKLAVTGTEETTATVNHITYGTGSACNEFTAYWKNSRPERYPLDKLRAWSGKGTDVEELVAGVNHLEFYSDAPVVSQMNIIDTPGIGAAVDFHEAVAQQFLSGGNTDALLYVFGHVGREEDIKALETFRQMGLQGYETYNCVGVMHLWDDLYWNAAVGCSADEAMAKVNEHVETLRSQFARLLSAVVPVSAPLGLLATRAPRRFWIDVIELLSTYDTAQDFHQILKKRDSRWADQAPALFELWESVLELELPLSSFRMMLHYLYDKRPTSVEEAVESTMKLSGIPKLRRLLDTSFFKRRAIISLRQIRNKVQTLLKEVYLELSDALANLSQDVENFSAVAQEVRTPQLYDFIDLRLVQAREELERFQNAMMDINTLQIDIADRVQLMDDALYVLQDWQERTRWLGPAQLELIDRYANIVLSEAQPESDVAQLLKIAGQLDFMPSASARACAVKLRSIYSHLIAAANQ